jgi:inhibitor of KinA sporulation pathway (predicted exonuclease)
MASTNSSNALYIDFELLCWGGPPPPGMGHDIFQIGICNLNLETLKVTRPASLLVKPGGPWEISEFCTKLTGFTADDVRRRGRPLSEVLATVTNLYGSNKSVFAWGEDRKALQEQCAKFGIDPVPLDIIDLEWQFRQLFMPERRKMRVALKHALEFFGIKPEGRAHTAMWDAYNTAQVHAAMFRECREAALEISATNNPNEPTE